MNNFKCVGMSCSVFFGCMTFRNNSVLSCLSFQLVGTEICIMLRFTDWI